MLVEIVFTIKDHVSKIYCSGRVCKQPFFSFLMYWVCVTLQTAITQTIDFEYNAFFDVPCDKFFYCTHFNFLSRSGSLRCQLLHVLHTIKATKAVSIQNALQCSLATALDVWHQNTVPYFSLPSFMLIISLAISFCVSTFTFVFLLSHKCMSICFNYYMCLKCERVTCFWIRKKKAGPFWVDSQKINACYSTFLLF